MKNAGIGEPLTLEQLREMDGQPVWVEYSCGFPANQWRVIKFHEDGKILAFTDERYEIMEEYGEVWLAYAYAPAHIDLEEWTAEWKEYTGADVGFHYCSKCKQQAFNYEDGGEVVEVLSDFCPGCARAMTEKGMAELEKRLRG